MIEQPAAPQLGHNAPPQALGIPLENRQLQRAEHFYTAGCPVHLRQRNVSWDVSACGQSAKHVPADRPVRGIFSIGAGIVIITRRH